LTVIFVVIVKDVQMLLIYKVILYVYLFLNFSAAQAQRDYNHRHFRILEIRGFSGSHLHTGELIREVLESGYWAVNVRYGWQSANPEGWQSKYLYPAYGIGWYNGFVGNPELLGNPGAFFGFVSFPLFHHHRHQMVIEPAFGISFDFEPFHQDDNQMNDAIGSRFNIYFNLNLGAKYRLNRELDLVYGLDLTHFSNGRTFRPNAGLNMFGFNAGIRYHFNIMQNKVDNSSHPQTILPARPVLEVFNRSERLRLGHLNFYAGGSVVQNTVDMGTNHQYGTATAMLEYIYVLNTKSAFAGGVNFFYDGSLRPQNIIRHFQGMHAGYDFRFWKMSIRMQMGTYFNRRAFEYKGNFFLRPALKYEFNNRIFAQLGLKTLNGPRADWMEAGFGVRLTDFTSFNPKK
jgi:hypothetical protein